LIPAQQADQSIQSHDSVLFAPDVSQRDRDKAIWSSFKSGNKNAFTFIFNTYIKILYGYGEKITRDKALVQDCIQDLFIELWKKRALLSDTDSIRFYLFKSLRRNIVRKLTGHSKFIQASTMKDDFCFSIEFSHEDKLIAEQLSGDQQKLLSAALETLTNRQREAIYLKFYQKLSSQEIADTLEIDINSLYNLISKSIETLRKALSENSGKFFL
jgi:RNA polymerase sigma factor (sigma-70 family)